MAVTFLRQKASLPRVCSVGIYQSLMELYQHSGAKLPLIARCLLAYFARYNENEALPLSSRYWMDSSQVRF